MRAEGLMIDKLEYKEISSVMTQLPSGTKNGDEVQGAAQKPSTDEKPTTGDASKVDQTEEGHDTLKAAGPAPEAEAEAEKVAKELFPDAAKN